jgi:phosphoglycolate phosphatase-like HAD superfamily hydrolase
LAVAGAVIGVSDFDWKGSKTIVRVRPGAKEFVSAVKELGRAFVLTMGTTAHQAAALEAAGLRGEFEGVFGRDEFGKVPQSPRSLLVDDLSPSSFNVIDKLHAMGVVKNHGDAKELAVAMRDHFVRVPSYQGEEDDDGLAEALPEVVLKARGLAGLAAASWLKRNCKGCAAKP